MTEEPEKLLTTSEVGQIFRVSANTIQAYARAGLLPFIRTPGGHYRFRASDVRSVFREASDGVPGPTTEEI